MADSFGEYGRNNVNSRIAQALSRLFERHRIVFWHDTKRELREEFDSMQLAGVEKVELVNNEFGVKYHILREKPEQKFLLYREGSQPEMLDNWLLDVELAYGEFRADQSSIWLSELELGSDFQDVVKDHAEFYKSAKRIENLKKLLKADDTPGMIRLKMLAVCAGSAPQLDMVVEHLLDELAGNASNEKQLGLELLDGDRYRLIERCRLDGYFWELMKRSYGYEVSEPGLKDFVIELFKYSFTVGKDGNGALSGDALVFLKRWKDSRQFERCFEALSDECAEILRIEEKLEGLDFRQLIELDYFRLIDRKIISDLVRALASQTVFSHEVTQWIRQRRQGHWFEEFHHYYEAVEYAALFMHAMEEAKLDMNSMADGVQQYSRFWFRLDQFYRKFTHHASISAQASLMAELSEKIENLYSNNFLLKLNDRWQSFVDKADSWEASPVPLQKSVFERFVQPFLSKKNKVCLIISDALRYEIGDELLSLIRQEDRYEANLEPVLSMLPSYTQLGMAALLPHRVMELADNDTGTVMVDGLSSQGTVNRTKLLGQSAAWRGTAVKADEVMALKGDECRALVRDHDVVYLYHNRIDLTGDKRESEERVFEAVEECLKDLVKLIKKLTGANANNLLVTSDHGFLYQNRALDESDFSAEDVEGDLILFRDRRFVLGKGLKEAPGLRKFHASQLGLAGDMEVQIPKSINRLRLKGSGSRYVHGGASLQEVVIPLIRINKKRQSDLSVVDVDIIRGTSSVITSGQLAVVLYQSQPVTEKVQARTLVAGIYTLNGDLISDSHSLVFDVTSDNARDRERQVRFLLTSKADKVNGQEVILRLDEKYPGTSHYGEYKSIRYLMRRSFTSDFDF
jgi:uncharacterized protein (TIGR02687 family)